MFYWAGLCLVCTAFCRGQAKSPSQSHATVSAASAEARIAPPPPGYRFPNRRTYVFNVEWHFVNAGTATVKLEDAGPEERVTALANSAGVVNALYKVNDRFQAYFDPRTFCSLRIEKHTEEGFRKRETQVHFEYARRKSVLDEKNLKNGETKHAENDVPACVTDVISGFYYLASLPLQPGSVETFPINDGGKTTDVVARVEAREQIKVPAGTYQTVRVKSEAVSGPLKGKGTVWVWFTDDPNHIPVQMRSKLGWGTLLFRMQAIE